jgi:hypothetical protein
MAEPLREPKTVSLAPDIIAEVEKRVKAGDAPNFSRFTEDALRKTFSTETTATPDAASPTILVELCRRLRPDIAPLLEKHIERHAEEMGGEVLCRLNGFYQPAILARLLEALLAYLADGSKHGWERPLKLTDRELFSEVEKALLIGEPDIAVGILLKLSSLDGADMPDLVAKNQRMIDSKSRAAFTRRWRAELDLPFTPVTELQAAEDPIPYPQRPAKAPPRPKSTGTTP